MKMNIMISKLRYNLKMSQEEFAGRLGVSRQAVQKWESGATLPDAVNLVNISKQFHISLDSLLTENTPRSIEEHYRTILSARDHRLWEVYEEDLPVEYRQGIEEGLDIEAYKEVFEAVSHTKPGEYKKRMGDVLFDICLNAPTRNQYSYLEPSDLENIKSLRSEYDYQKKEIQIEELKDKIKGAWLGRICGCLLGKPIEGIHTHELIPLLKHSQNFPMHRYIRSTDITDEMVQKTSFPLMGRCFADTMMVAPADDDTNYTVLSNMLIEQFGTDFTPKDVLEMWTQYQTKNAYCTAERVAWKNYVNGYCPPDTAMYKNPYREWIGAQIRGDYFGYINPGKPEFAAELAWRDASISHIKNGIYGEMWVAAMLAYAPLCHDIKEVILGGLAQIPSTSRLYEAIRSVLVGVENGVSQEELRGKIHSAYDEKNPHDWCHTIPNAMIVVMALLYNETDYAKSVGSAVQTGFDTDCNGATVGSIIGMMRGSAAIGREWTDCIHGKLETNIIGVGTLTIEELIERTMVHINQVRARHL